MIEIKRWHNEDCTIGRLICDNFQCFTLELPDVANEQHISCIPAGEYEYYFRESPTNKDVLELRNVPERRYIQIHAGNFTSEIQGCILVGNGVKWLNKDSIPDVTNSKSTLKKLLEIAGKSGRLKIR